MYHSFRGAACNKAYSATAFRFADSVPRCYESQARLVVRQLSGAIAGADADKTERLRVDAQNQSLREQVSLRGDESDY